MKNSEAVILLMALKNMLLDPYGEPISDVYYALDIAIRALDAEGRMEKRAALSVMADMRKDEDG